ncbi:hypothetical protein PCG10_010391 [Penicillium crustosum]|uniref:Uncharacterized protein n=1 Tax=Penicillium crustosum TaxID=36656 RepID=A0A9P5L0W3_PENCR|nr:Craniofacial development protein 1/Bucentaur [Penicillium crustosum]KAF7519024.1 hypothetical protein PCG10_010391 [Penicillium crustosum]KAJ5409212.1 Craniofacial development protein 1/Bucentaur [Penicillium crustosum]
MSQQRPPSGAGGGRHDGGRLAQRRCNEAWRSMDRQNAAQAAAQAVQDARVIELVARAIQHRVDQEGFQPSPARDARVAELIVRALDAHVDLRREQNFSARGSSFRGGRGRGDMQGGRRGRGRGRGGGRGGRSRDSTREAGRGRYDHRCGHGAATTREGGRGGYDHRYGHDAAHRAGVFDAGRQNPPSDQVTTRQHSGHQVVRQAAPSGPRA